MKFGSVPDAFLSNTDLRLPPEPAENATVLSGARTAPPAVYIGATTWGAPAWSGSIYPLKTPASKYRQFYPQHFNSIELNATHYNTYSPGMLQQWAAPAAGLNFKFCPKFPQSVSHHSGFQNIDTETAAFLQSISAFGNQLGPAFLQTSEAFSPQQKDTLYGYLRTLPAASVFLEVRHPGWFRDEAVRTELFQTLMHLHMGLVITDTPGRRDLVHQRLTVPLLFLRFVCNGVHPTSFSRTDAWVAQIKIWLERGLEEAYIFLHPGNDAAVPELAAYWVHALNTKCGLQLKPPAFFQQQLF